MLLLAVVGAAVVFFSIAGYVSDVRSQVEPYVTVLRVSEEVTAYRPLTETQLEEYRMPRRWVTDSAVRERSDTVGQVPATDLEAGSMLQSDMLVPEPDLEPGQREIAILIDAETGVAGKVGSGNIVDIVATFEGDEGIAPKSQYLVLGARVIDVGVQRTQEARGPVPQEEQVVPVTFALSKEEALVLAYAESFAAEVRLALVRADETGRLSPKRREFELPGQGRAGP